MTHYLARMSPREKTLGAIVAGVIFIFLNLFLLGSLTRKQAALRADLEAKQTEWQDIQSLSSQEDLWTRRDAILQRKLPRWTNEGQAGVELSNDLQQIAKTNHVSIESPAIDAQQTARFYRSAPVTIETKSSWTDLMHFLYTLQSPERFVAVEEVTLNIDPQDATAMRGKFKIARFYAP